MKRTSILLAALIGSGGLALAQRPVIAANGVQDAASYTPNIAQGSVFVVKGTNLCSPGLVQSSLPLPRDLNGVRITFTPASGGTAVDAYMVYTFNQNNVNQLAAVLPSGAAPGAYNVTVTNNGQTSDPLRTNVVARKFSIITVNGSGSGRAVAQNYISASQLDINRFTTGTLAGFTTSPSKPGQFLILWGTGMGPITQADNIQTGAIDLRGSAGVTVVVGGTEIPASYAGRSGLPGTDIVQFTLPNNVATGCSVPLQVRVGSELSNDTTISIAAASADACVHPTYSRATLANLDQGGTITAGSFVLSSFATTLSLFGQTLTTNTEGISGSFSRYTADQLDASSPVPTNIGACHVYRRVGTQGVLLLGAPPVALDAGAQLTLNGPNVSNKAVPRDTDKTYSATLGTQGIPGLPGGGSSAPSIAAGTYTLRGTGGADIGAFNASVTVGAPVRVGNVPATIPRSSNLTVTWTGGASGEIVAITGVSGSAVQGSTDVYDAGVFVCTAPANAGTFTVPSSVLAQLPPTPAGGILSGGIGALLVVSSSVPTSSNGLFTAPLTAGGNIDNGVFVSTVGSLNSVTYQ